MFTAWCPVCSKMTGQTFQTTTRACVECGWVDEVSSRYQGQLFDAIKKTVAESKESVDKEEKP